MSEHDLAVRPGHFHDAFGEVMVLIFLNQGQGHLAGFGHAGNNVHLDGFVGGDLAFRRMATIGSRTEPALLERECPLRSAAGEATVRPRPMKRERSVSKGGVSDSFPWRRMR